MFLQIFVLSSWFFFAGIVEHVGGGGADSRLKSTNLSLDQLLNELFILAGGFPELVGELETYRSSKVVTFRKKNKTANTNKQENRSTVHLPSPRNAAHLGFPAWPAGS